jgi:AraC family L-rhamnose operon transcriptional activator RhaR/AraC family L-rhamnose operon regulatory protein RhaS
LRGKDYDITRGDPIQIIPNMVQIGTSVHQHDFGEIAIVTSGRGLHISGSQRWRLTRGDAFYVDTRGAHAISEVHDLEMMLILFDPVVLDEIPLTLRLQPGFSRFFELPATGAVRSGEIARTRLREPDLESVKEWGYRLRDALASPGADRHARALACFSRIAEFLAVRTANSRGCGMTPRESVEKLINYIGLYYHEKISLAFLAELADMTPRTLCRWFRQQTGSSPIEYLLHFRLTQAAKLLGTGHVSVSEAAYRSGFLDSNYFSRQFRAVYHQSPSTYRRQHSPSG